MIKKRWANLPYFYKGMIIAQFYLILLLVISLILLIDSPSWVYGFILGAVLVYVSYFISWIIYFKTPFKNKVNVWATTLVWLIRILLYMVTCIIVVFVINNNINGGSLFEQNNLIWPFNVLSMLFVYLVPMYAYFTIPLVDLMMNKR